MKITETEYNAITGETIIIERDENEKEKIEREAFEAEMARRKTEAEAKAAARQAILDRLGITEEEAKLLLG